MSDDDRLDKMASTLSGITDALTGIGRRLDQVDHAAGMADRERGAISQSMQRVIDQIDAKLESFGDALSIGSMGGGGRGDSGMVQAFLLEALKEERKARREAMAHSDPVAMMDRTLDLVEKLRDSGGGGNDGLDPAALMGLLQGFISAGAARVPTPRPPNGGDGAGGPPDPSDVAVDPGGEF